MSGASSYLQKLRKGDLVDLANSVGFTEHDGLKKSEIEVAFEKYLNENASTYSDDPRLSSFYGSKRRGDHSPVKKESSAALSTAESTLKSVKRRVTKAADEIVATDDPEAEPATTRARSALTRTPARGSALSNLSFASSVPLPPSPAVVANAIQRKTSALHTSLTDYYEESGAVDKIQNTRESLSSVTAVQVLVILFELWNLRAEVLPNRYAFSIPAIKFISSTDYPVNVPDFFLLLTSSFWGPTLLWAFTSFLVPTFAAYFVNLTHTKPSRSNPSGFKYTVDPLVFNIVKALLTFVIYGQDITFGGLVDLEYVARINSAIFGGYKGVLTGTGIGALTAVYEAIIQK